MTDAEIMELLTRDCDNWQKGKVLREAFDAITKAPQPSAFNVKPQVQRKKREPRTITHATRFNTATGEMEEIKHEQ